jgi:hemerythrin
MPDTTWKIEWSDAFSVSNVQIDAEHQHFVALVNELNAAIVTRRDRVEVVRIMNLIVADAVVHFLHEEGLFAEREYPRAQEHRQSHAELMNTFRQALKKIQQPEHSQEWIATGLGLGIRNRLTEHLLNEDAQYIDYLRQA